MRYVQVYERVCTSICQSMVPGSFSATSTMGDGTLKSVGTIVVLIFPDSIIYWPIFRKFIQILSNTKFSIHPED